VDDNKNVTWNKFLVLTLGEDENVEWHFTQAEKLQQIMSEEEEKKRNYHQWISARQKLQRFCAEAKVFLFDLRKWS
jgi:transposase